MDARSKQVLAQITANVPRHLADALMYDEVDTSQEEMVQRWLRDPTITSEHKYKLSNMLNAGKFRTSEREPDPRIVAKLDEYFTTEVEYARSKGLLGDPTEDDPWLKARMARMQARQGK